ncbi:MAG TPA: CBS domain-containing protein [Actinomycetota bacterium]|nr:CBS domain-containing protein [Actinomycetota bacterium]
MKSQVVPTRSLIRIRGSASIQEAAQLMCDMSMGALGVDDVEHEFLGLVTERDLMWAAALGKDPIETPVKEIVNDFPIVVDGPITGEVAARRMRSGHIRHLIVRETEDLRIVSMRDLLPDCLDGLDSTTPGHMASASEMGKMFGVALAGGKNYLI